MVEVDYLLSECNFRMIHVADLFSEVLTRTKICVYADAGKRRCWVKLRHAESASWLWYKAKTSPNIE